MIYYYNLLTLQENAKIYKNTKFGIFQGFT